MEYVPRLNKTTASRAAANVSRRSRVVQLAAPVPVKKEETKTGDMYKDPDTDVQFTKLGDKLFLLNGRMINWSDPNYTNIDQKVIDLKAESRVAEKDADVLDVTQGEAGYLDAKSPYKSIRTTNASPCVILMIYDTGTKQTMLTHIHRANKVKSVLDEAGKRFDPDSMDINVSITTLKYKGAREGEKERQDEIIKDIKDTVGGVLYSVDAKDVVVDEANENAEIAVATGAITHPKDEEVERNRGTLGLTRAIHHEKGWQGQEAKDDKHPIEVRTANVMPTDAAIFPSSGGATGTKDIHERKEKGGSGEKK